MPANTVKINDKIEYIVPDSWMPTLIAYLEKVHKETGGEGHYNLQVWKIDEVHKCRICNGRGAIGHLGSTCGRCQGTGKEITEHQAEAY